MTARRARRDTVSRTAYGIDRMLRNVQTGHFERSLSALTAAGALVTAAEIYFEHDSASFGNKMMWLPVALGPVGAVAGVAGFCSRRMAKTALPITSAAIVANGLQGLYLHARGIAQKPRPCRNESAWLLPNDGRRTNHHLRLEHWSCLGALCEFLPLAENRVTLADEKDQYGLPVARFSYSQCDNDRALAHAAQSVMEDILRAADFRTVPMRGAQP
jgi:hypothetical protein